MKHHGSAHKMVQIAMKKMPCTRDEYTPPGGWTQEPDDFNSLKLGMTKGEAEKFVTLRNCTVTTIEVPGFPAREHFLYDTTLNVGGLAVPGQVLFIEDQLINLGGKFDRSLWDVIKAAFIDLYGRPHVDERREIFEQGPSRRLDWQGDRVQISLIDFPDSTEFARFWFQKTLKGAKLQMAVTLRRTETPPRPTPVGAGSANARTEAREGFPPQRRLPTPPPDKPKIIVERTSAMLVFRLPNGTILNYSRRDPSQTSMRSTWHHGGGERFVYDLEIDATTLSRIGVGDEGTHFLPEAVSQPDGWPWSWNGWMLRRNLPDEYQWFQAHEGHSAAIETSQLTDPRKFSITSTMLPGPVPIDLVSQDVEQRLRSGDSRWIVPVTLPRLLYDAVQEKLGEQTAFLNSTFIIGPAIDPNSTEDTLRPLVQMWIDGYGFSFLEPALISPGSLLNALDQLQLNAGFEGQIVQCLRAAL